MFWIESFLGPIQWKNEFSKRIAQGYVKGEEGVSSAIYKKNCLNTRKNFTLTAKTCFTHSLGFILYTNSSSGDWLCPWLNMLLGGRQWSEQPRNVNFVNYKRTWKWNFRLGPSVKSVSYKQDSRFLLTQGQHIWSAFCKIFLGIPHLTIFGDLKEAPKYGQIWPNAVLGCVLGCANYGQVGYPWKDLAKCNSDALTLCQWGPPVKSYDRISFLADFPTLIIIQN